MGSRSVCSTPTIRRRRLHASHGEHEAIVTIDPIALREGGLPAPAARRVLEWARLHQDELRENWDRARRFRPLARIDPLP
jgi:hypothetical protein